MILLISIIERKKKDKSDLKIFLIGAEKKDDGEEEEEEKFLRSSSFNIDRCPIESTSLLIMPIVFLFLFYCHSNPRYIHIHSYMMMDDSYVCYSWLKYSFVLFFLSINPYNLFRFMLQSQLNIQWIFKAYLNYFSYHFRHFHA